MEANTVFCFRMQATEDVLPILGKHLQTRFEVMVTMSCYPVPQGKLYQGHWDRLVIESAETELYYKRGKSLGAKQGIRNVPLHPGAEQGPARSLTGSVN